MNHDQAQLWNGPSGHAWVHLQDPLERLFAPFLPVLLKDLAPGHRVLDIGCGTGSTTRAAANVTGHALGLDISEPMITAARQEPSTARFLCADAQTHAFAANEFDWILSRFGVMFFADPVAAFTNLRRAASQLRAIAWRSPADNPFMTTAERAAAPFVELPPRVPDAPGQFAFAHRDRVATILHQAGWTGVEITPLDVACALPAHQLPDYYTRLGPLGTLLPQLDQAQRNRILEAVESAFAPFIEAGEARFNAACWLIEAS